jgi:uncharacterized membrane protein
MATVAGVVPSQHSRLGRAGLWLPTVAASALAMVALTRRSPAALAAGAAIAYGGFAGQVPLPDWLRARLPQRDGKGFVVVRAVTILRPREELYAVWRNFENLPRFMRYLQSVSITGDDMSHWVATGPGGTTIAWDAQLVEDQPNKLLRWRSVPRSLVPNRGLVRFTPAPGDRGTEVRVRLEYDPPGGLLGASLAQVLGDGADRQVRESLRNFKQLMEAGEIPTNDRQPMGTCRRR